MSHSVTEYFTAPCSTLNNTVFAITETSITDEGSESGRVRLKRIPLLQVVQVTADVAESSHDILETEVDRESHHRSQQYISDIGHRHSA